MEEGPRYGRSREDATDVLARQRQTYDPRARPRRRRVRVGELARDLGVSDMTVRRDLELSTTAA